jgi:hypothetical protein
VRTGTNLPGGDYFLIVVPVAVALFGWVVAVFWANRHPQVRQVRGAPRSVAGGVFQGTGRSVMPTRDAVPPEARTVPAQGAPPGPESAGPESAGDEAVGVQPSHAASATAGRPPERGGRPLSPDTRLLACLTPACRLLLARLG